MAAPLIRKIGQYGLASGVPAVVNFTTMAALTHLLTRAEYGTFALVQAVVAVVNAVGFQWLRSGVRRFLPTAGEARPAVLAAAGAGYGALLGAALVGAFGTVLFPGRPVPVSLVWLGFLLLASQTWYELNAEIVLAEVNPRVYGLAGLGRALVNGGTGVALAATGFGAQGVLIGGILGFALPGLALGRRHWRGVAVLRAEAERVREYLNYGLPLTMSYALQFVMDASDRLLLGALIGVEAAGVYAVAYDLTQQTINFLMVAVNLAAFPLAVRALEQEGAARAREGFRVQAVVLALLGVPGAVGLAVLAPRIGQGLLGSQFSHAAAALVPIIAVGALACGFKAFYFDLAFQLARQTRPLVSIGIGGAACNILLNLLLIPVLGTSGAAWATVATFGLTVVAGALWGRRHLALPLPWFDWLKVAAITAVMALAVAQVPLLNSRVAALAVPVLLGVAIVVAGALALNLLGVRSWVVARAPRRPTA